MVSWSLDSSLHSNSRVKGKVWSDMVSIRHAMYVPSSIVASIIQGRRVKRDRGERREERGERREERGERREERRDEGEKSKRE